jgi:ribose 5-phosphate isomerase A
MAKGEGNPKASGKERAGRRAAEEVRAGMRVGLGTGSTVHFTIVAIGERKPDVTCVATSVATEELAAEVGLRVVPPGTVDRLDIAIDGADQVDAHFNLIKGGGGAHTREKIVASMADRFVVVVDESKVAGQLDIPVPLEVIEFAIDLVPKALTAFGATHVRQRSAPSDNGNPLLDAAFGAIEDPLEMALDLDAIPGLIEHGIFPAAMVDRVVVGSDGEDGGVRDLEKTGD